MISAFRTLLLASACAAAPTLAFAQSQQASQVDDVVVTASTRAQSVARAPASISVVTSEQLENKAYVDLFDAVRDVEGVSVSGGSNFQDILIRGLPGAYTLTLVDGRRQSTREARVNGNGGLEQSFTPPVGAIERIEVVRGPMSSLYGSDALGGVVNIITKKVPARWGGSVGADYVSQENGRSGDWHQGQFYLAGPVVSEKLGLQFWGRSLNRDEDHIYNAPSSTGSMGSDEYNLAGRIAWTPTTSQEILLQLDTAKIERTSTAGLTVAPTGRSVRNDHNRDSASLSWNGDWSWGTSAVSVMREEAQRVTYTADATGSLIRGGRAPEITNTVWDALFNVPLNGTPLGDHNLVFGGQVNQNKLVDVNPGARNNVAATFEVWQRALFVEDEIGLTDDLALTLGLRWDDHKRYGDHWSPRAYLVWMPSETLTLKGGVSTGFRAPDLRQTVAGWGQVSRGGNMYGNPDLTPEKSVTEELGILYDDGEGFNAGLTVFNNDFKDKITRVACPLSQCTDGPNQFGANPTTYLNVDKAVSRGVEANLKLPLGRDWSLTSSYTFTKSEQKTGQYQGQPLNQLPRHLFTTTVNWQASDALEAWARVNYRGKESQPITGPSSSSLVAPSYTFVDLGGSYAVNKKVSVYAGIYNLFDKQVGYDDYGYVEDGRRYWLGVGVKF